MFLLGIFIVAACQPAQEQAIPSNGRVLTGNMSGREFAIATGNEDELVMDLNDAFNAMDADALWEISADTVTMHNTDGDIIPFTKAAMEELFASVDSIDWELDAVIPVQVIGSSRVNVFTDGVETLYFSDGTVDSKKLFERFVFEDGVLTAVYQWEAALPAEE